MTSSNCFCSATQADVAALTAELAQRDGIIASTTADLASKDAQVHSKEEEGTRLQQQICGLRDTLSKAQVSPLCHHCFHLTTTTAALLPMNEAVPEPCVSRCGVQACRYLCC